MKSQYSAEIINAFVDGELDGEEKTCIIQAMEQDDDLHQKIHALCTLKKSLKKSYAEMPLLAQRDDITVDRMFAWQQGVAVVLVLCLGLILGWLGQGHYTDNRLVANAETLAGIKLTPVDLQQSNKIILHITSSEPNKINKVLTQIKAIVQRYSQTHLPYKLEVVANASGIHLLREDVSPYKEDIAALISNYPNVSFIACSNAIDRLKMQGIEPHLIAHTRTGTTAIEQIVKRLQQGWIYLKV